MLDHTGFVVSDLARARRFYDAIAKPLGLGTIDNGEQAFLLGRSAQEPIPICGLARYDHRIGPKALGLV